MNKGFSLVELIVVIAIMAILVGVAVPVYTSYISKANTNVDKQTVGEVEHAIEVLLIDPDIDAPADGVITFTKANGLAYEDGSDADEFLNELNKIVPEAALKTLDNITFTIGADGYSVAVTGLPQE